MKIEDRRNDDKKKYAGIGDMIITDKTKYILLNNFKFDEEHPIALYNVSNNCIEYTTERSTFFVSENLIDEVIIEIVPRNELKLVVE